MPKAIKSSKVKAKKLRKDRAVEKMPRPIKFSKNENRLRELLPVSGRRITTDDLTQQFFAPLSPPLNGRVHITNLLRSIKRKTELMNADPNRRHVRVVYSTGGSGRAAHEVWLETSDDRDESRGERTTA